MKRWLFMIPLCLCLPGPAWSAAANAAKPNRAMQHMVKAPDIDFEHLRDPFESYLSVIRQQQHQNRAQQTDHSREPLEAFDLSTLKLVAIFSMGKKRVAMVEDSAGKGYLIHPGSYIGTNSGRVKKITDKSVILIEKNVAPTGEIVDKEVTLTLKEVNEPQS